MPTPFDDGLRPASPEMVAAFCRSILAPFEPKPVLVPYEEWSAEINELCQQRSIELATPANILLTVTQLPSQPPKVTVGHLVQHQESFYRAAYADVQFAIDRTKLGLTRRRVEDIKAALLRGEVDYPLVVCLPRSLSLEERGLIKRRHPTARLPRPRPSRTLSEAAPNIFVEDTSDVAEPSVAVPAEARSAQTLHRVLFERLIRQRRIACSVRTNPTLDEFLDQIRDVTLADLTRTDLLDSDGRLIPFDARSWSPYLQTLYRTLPRPVAQAGYTDIAFVAWEQDPPARRIVGPNIVPNTTIQGKSHLDAVTLDYPIITPSQYLALFSQYHGATRLHLDVNTRSQMFGIIDPVRSQDHSAVSVGWGNNALGLYGHDPAHAQPHDYLRCAR